MNAVRPLVLLVDDSPEDLSIYREILDTDYDLIEAQTPSCAFEMIRSSRPIAMLLDYRLPALNGVAMLGELGREGALDAMAVIVLTGTRGDQRLGIKALQAGAYDFLEKDNLSPELLRRSLANAVENICLTRELARQQSWFRRVLESVGDGVIVTDAEAKVTFLNPAAEKFFGRTLSEALGCSIDSILALKSPDDPRVTAAHAEAMEQVRRGKTIVKEFTLTRVAGVEAWVASFNYSPIVEPAERVVGAVVTIRDITERKQAEEAIQEREHQLNLALEGGHLASWDWNLVTDRVSWNDEHYRLLGYEVGEVQPGYEAWTNRLHPDDLAQITNRFQRAMNEGTEYQGEYRLLWPDGTVRWLEGRGRFVWDGKRRPVRSFGVAIDITERKQSEEALREHERRLRYDLNALRQLHQMSSRIIHDSDMHFVFQEVVNAAVAIGEAPWAQLHTVDPTTGHLALAAQSGFSENWVGHWNAVSQIPVLNGTVRSPERLIVSEELKKTNQSPKTVAALEILQSAGVETVQSTPLIDRAGHLIGVLSIHYHEVRRPDNHVLHYLELLARQVADMVERTNTERARQESEERLRLFIRYAPVPLAMFDRDMRYLAVSQRWLKDFGCTEAILGQRHYDVFPHVPEHWKTAHKVGLAGDVVGVEADRFFHPDGRVQWLRWEVRPWCETDGAVGGIVIFTEDITARKRADMQLQAYRRKAEAGQQREIVAQTAAAIAHELNQPLNAVCNFADAALRLWRDGNPQPEMLIESLGKAVKQARRAGQTMRDLHAVLNKAQLDSEPINLIACLAHAIDVYDTQGFRAQINAMEPLPWVVANRIHVEKILGILLTNAVEAMQDAGLENGVIQIEVQHSHSERFVFVRVCDNGIGVDPKLGVEVLEPLVTTKRTGLGMGLSLARSLVRAYGGDLGLDLDVASGACVHFSLPAVQ